MKILIVNGESRECPICNKVIAEGDDEWLYPLPDDLWVYVHETCEKSRLEELRKEGSS